MEQMVCKKTLDRIRNNKPIYSEKIDSPNSTAYDNQSETIRKDCKYELNLYQNPFI